jgi:type IV pilus biogenesis protein PilP
VTLRTVIPPLLALVLLLIVGSQTSSALRDSGTWRSRQRPTRPTVNPYASLERSLARSDTMPALAGLRDPFSYGRAGATTRVVVRRPVTPPAPTQPIVTAIVTDADAAHAIVRYEGTSYSVKSGDLFAQYRVVSITADAVVIDDGRQQLVLKRPTKGD